MFANVPRDITASLPRREPYELKSRGARPFSDRYLAAGLFRAMLPAGEMWSVVIESPKYNKTFAFSIGSIGAGSFCFKFQKKLI